MSTQVRRRERSRTSARFDVESRPLRDVYMPREKVSELLPGDVSSPPPPRTKVSCVANVEIIRDALEVFFLTFFFCVDPFY